jgi:hypothetical protein
VPEGGGEMRRPTRLGQTLAASTTASGSLFSTPDRDMARPSRFGKSSASGPCAIRAIHSLRRATVLDQSGTTRCLRPFPWM